MKIRLFWRWRLLEAFGESFPRVDLRLEHLTSGGARVAVAGGPDFCVKRKRLIRWRCVALTVSSAGRRRSERCVEREGAAAVLA